MIESIAILGNGRVGTYFARSMQKAGLKVNHYARTPKQEQLEWQSYQAHESLCILCLPDDKIAELSAQLPTGDGIICHSSGTQDLQSIDAKHRRRGIFYPLMSLRKDSTLALREVPLCLEAERSQDLEILLDFCKAQGWQARHLSDSDRQKIHLAAVLTHNFGNYLHQLAYQVLAENNLPLSLLKPLLEQQLRDWDENPPLRRQTGPAVRGDKKTEQKHLAQLNERDAELYQFLSEAIKRDYEKEL